jgi:hypothetical protein
MDAVAAAEAALPAAVMDADFTAGLDIVRAVIALARACPPEGPHLGDLPNAAFVPAMFQSDTRFGGGDRRRGGGVGSVASGGGGRPTRGGHPHQGRSDDAGTAGGPGGAVVADPPARPGGAMSRSCRAEAVLDVGW